MKGKWLIAGILIFILLALCGVSLFALWQGYQMVNASGVHINLSTNTVQATGTEEKTLKVNGPVDLAVQNDFGDDITVQTGGDGQVHLLAEKTAWGSGEEDAQEMLKRLTVVVEQTGNKIKITVQQPVEVNALHIGPVGGTVKFTITVPKAANVTLRSSNGDLSLTGTTGAADLQTDFGSVSLADVKGVVQVHSNNGSVDARNIGAGDQVTLTSEFGNITVKGLDGSDVTLSSTNGALEAKGIQASGLLKAESDFGSISLSDCQAKQVDIQSQNSKVTLENLNVEGKLTVKSEFGDASLTKVDASSYDIDTTNGKISMDAARGPVKLHSEFGEIELFNGENVTLDLSSNNGSITFTGSLAGGPHSITSEFGNITLTIPVEIGLNVDLQTEFGKIKSDFEITVSGELDSNHWQGKFNGGGEQLTVKATNGNITINSK
jgi:DUF4097 and DUF4098 domain-containing protein YvlB